MTPMKRRPNLQVTNPSSLRPLVSFTRCEARTNEDGRPSYNIGQRERCTVPLSPLPLLPSIYQMFLANQGPTLRALPPPPPPPRPYASAMSSDASSPRYAFKNWGQIWPCNTKMRAEITAGGLANGEYPNGRQHRLFLHFLDPIQTPTPTGKGSLDPFLTSRRRR